MSQVPKSRVRNITRVPRLPRRATTAHKGTFGTVVVIAGSESMLGAAILCARGALRGGAGLVSAVLPASLRTAFMTAVPAATTQVRVSWRRAVDTAEAVVIGPGLGQDPGAERLVRAVLAHAAVPVVVDADALNIMAPLRRPRSCKAPRVLLPHPGEAGRLLGTDAAVVQRDREFAAAELAKRSGMVAVLKGHQTIVTDGSRRFCNTTGNPGMATGGSGDVLAGLCGALLAQGMEAFAAACLAVHAHGKAGDLVARRLSPAGLCAEDLPLAIAEVLT